MASSYVLLQYGSDPWPTRFEDLESRQAFTIIHVEEQPNLLLKLIREPAWSQQHPDIMGPTSSFFYFGPARSPGHLAYGNTPTQPMVNSLRQKRDISCRYFVAQNGKEYKWKIAIGRFECYDTKGTMLAVWETAQRYDPYSARLTIKHAGLPIVTEILTTLTLNRIAQSLSW